MVKRENTVVCTCFMERTGMMGRLKISKAFVQGQPKVQFQRIEERLKTEARIYVTLEKWLGTETHTFLLSFPSLKSAFAAPTASKDRMPSHPRRQHYGKETYTESYFCIFHNQCI